MSDIWTEIFKKYGTAAIIFALVASLCIWVMAHWATAPGSEVSVLWGLVKYTKVIESQSQQTLPQELPTKSQQHNFSSSSDISNKSASLVPINIEIQEGIPHSKIKQAIQSLREKHGLRELTTFESGKYISELPNGTFFFTLVGWMENSPPFSGTIDSRILSLRADRYKSNSGYIEVHCISAREIQLVGFMSETDASSISHLTGETDHKVVLAPLSWGSMTTLVSIPINRIQSSHCRELQNSTRDRVDILDLTIK